MGAAARIEVSDSFRIRGRGEVVIYRELEGTLTLGAEVVAEQRGDRWRVTSFGPFFGSPHHEGELPPAFLFRPLGDARRIQAGEIFRAVEFPEVSEPCGKPGHSHSELDHA